MMLDALVFEQKKFFTTTETFSYDFRIKQLDLFWHFLKTYEDELSQAVFKDLKRPPYETYLLEIGLLYHEIRLIKKNLTTWMSPKKVTTDVASWPASSWIVPSPYGTTLVIGAWNYPIQLLLLPALSALAAGNTVVLKPSELAPTVAKVIAKGISEIFDPKVLTVIEAGPEETEALLHLHFDKVFFTGSTRIGRLVAEICGKQLTPVTLELGGKSPVVVLGDADVKIAARRIIWGKYLNAGQTCIAPDFIYVHRDIVETLLNHMVNEIKNKFGERPITGTNLSAIVNQRNFNRLTSFLTPENIFFGGQMDNDRLKISPTILYPLSWAHPIMQDESFGPILPVLEFTEEETMLAMLRSRPCPLAMYVFSQDLEKARGIMRNLRFGGGAINDTIMHCTNPKMPFGGVGDSGTGSYHGEHGFRCFSHHKSVLEKMSKFDPFLKYPPYSNWKLKILKWLMERF